MKLFKAYNTSGYLIPVLSIVSLYCISYGFMLLNGGLFHDDILYYLLPHDAFQMWSEEARAGWTIYSPLLFKMYSSVSGIYLERIITFLSHLTTALIFLYLLIKIFNLTHFSSLALFGIFLLLPLFHARISTLIVIYTLSNLCFFLGFLCVYLYTIYKRWIFRLLALLLFYLSFYTEAILVIYLLAIAFLWYSYPDKISEVRDAFLFFIKHLDFILVPLLFWTLRALYFYPTGRYAGYTDPTLYSLLLAILKTFTGFNSSLWEPLKQSLIASLLNPIRTIILFCIPFFCLGEPKDTDSSKRELTFLLLGFVAFYLSLFPYFSAGKHEFTGFGSRFQLLVPLGASLLIFFGIRKILRIAGCSNLFIKIVICLLLASFTVANLEASLQYQQQYIVRKALISTLKSDSEMTNYHTFLLRDGGYYYNTRPDKPWDTIGILRQAFGDETRFGKYAKPNSSCKENIRVFKYFSNKPKKVKMEYGFRDWSLKPNESILELKLKRGESFPNQRDAILITLKCLFGGVKCDKALSGVVAIDKKILTQKDRSITK